MSKLKPKHVKRAETIKTGVEINATDHERIEKNQPGAAVRACHPSC
jgi:hypothetical protein